MKEKLSKDDGQLLLSLARQSISAELGAEGSPLDQLRSRASKTILNENRGTFVTLHKKGVLRGCIGNIEPVKSVFEGVADNAKHAAFKDMRFTPLVHQELEDTKIEISILTRPEPLEYTSGSDLISKLKPKVHGVIIEKGHHKAVFLPQVWDQLDTPEAFLGHLCSKAGLQTQEWKTGDLEVSVYQVQSFEESD